MTTTNGNWNQWSEEQAGKANAGVAFNEAVWTHVERSGNAATLKALADALYAIGNGTSADPITRIVKELWELADRMSD